MFILRKIIFMGFIKSGSGKTSLLNLLAGFIKPDGGNIMVNGKNEKYNKLIELFKIGYSSQIPTILDENILVNSTLKYENSKKDIKKLKQILSKFGLQKFSSPKYFSKEGLTTIKGMFVNMRKLAYRLHKNYNERSRFNPS